MDPRFINTVEIVVIIIYSILSSIFTLLILFVLVYYIRRRYKLYKEIHRIPQELLIMESYRNHLKNLKIRCTINNFVIIILMMEIMLNLSQILMNFPYLITQLVKEYNPVLLSEIQNYSPLFSSPIYYSLVPVLSMLMDFLWLAYRKYECKYTIIKWTWYMVIKTVFVFLVECSTASIPVDYTALYNGLISIFYGISPIIDFIQFAYYARKFYLHLKTDRNWKI